MVEKKNRTDHLYCLLEDAILSGENPAGSQLKPGQISQKCGISLSVAREALSRLVNDGLVEQHSNRGFFIISLSPEHLKNLVEARKLNEVAALRKAIQEGDLEWESKLIAAFHKLEHYTQILSCETFHQWREAHRIFHYVLFAGCPNQVLVELCERLWKMSELYRAQAMGLDQDRNSLVEHKEILDATLNRDEKTAAKLYEQHIERTLTFILTHGSENKNH